MSRWTIAVVTVAVAWAVLGTAYLWHELHQLPYVLDRDDDRR